MGRLGLRGTVDRERYFALCDNLNPDTGDALTPHTKNHRRVLYDFTFDAPKSVSLAYELGGHEDIMDAFRGAVVDSMNDMERALMTRVRSRKRNEDRPSANWIWAEFLHRTTRPVTDENGVSLPDPQLHCHAVAFNCTFDTVENRFKAAEFSNLVRDKGYYQAAFHSRLAERLEALGHGIERDRNSFRLAGFTKEMEAKFSRRSAIIDAEVERLGITDAKTKGELGRRTREGKGDAASTDLLDSFVSLGVHHGNTPQPHQRDFFPGELARVGQLAGIHGVGKMRCPHMARVLSKGLTNPISGRD